VLIVAAGLGIGGAEVVIRHLLETLDRSRFQVTVCCIKALGSIGEDLVRRGFDVVTLSDDGLNKVEYFTFVKLRRLIRQRRIDVVHSHTTDALADAAVCRLLVPRVKLVHTFHFGNYPHVDGRLLWMERIFSRLASRLIAVGRVQAKQIEAAHHLDARHIGVVLNGVTPGTATADGAFRARVGAGDRVLIGTLATMIEQKGLADLLRVAAALRDAGVQACFVVIGEGRLRGELESLRRELRLEDVVVFTGWVADAATVALPDLDVFFQPSLWEAMSIAVLEAMAAGKPIVATRVGENPYVVDDGVDGLLVDARDVGGRAAALRRLIESPQLRARMGEAGARKVRERFTVMHMTRAYEGIYTALVSGRPGRP
jgi:glycosyltransferase involved in cell wall biosynthesis